MVDPDPVTKWLAAVATLPDALVNLVAFNAYIGKQPAIESQKFAFRTPQGLVTAHPFDSITDPTQQGNCSAVCSGNRN